MTTVSETSTTMIADALAVRDLTDPTAGRHAIQLVVDRLEERLAAAWRIPVHRDPGPRVVAVRDNYDRLGYPPDAVTRERRYSRYIDDATMLRSHTSARIPALLDRIGAGEGPDEILLCVPGICYRRDVIDRHHVGEPHQMDLWRIRRRGPALAEADLVEMIRLVVGAILPLATWSTVPGPHPYTLAGREIYADGVEVGECGLSDPRVLAGCGLPAGASGLAMGLGLDRLTMLAKGLTDIRLLRSDDLRVSGQMTDLEPYRLVSSMPAVRRDLSLAVDSTTDLELLGDQTRQALGPAAEAVEEVVVLSETSYADLPESARRRMGLHPGQKNVLVRLVLRHPSRSLTDEEANALRDRAYAGLHRGSAHEWTSS